MDCYSFTNLNAVDFIRITNSDIRADWDEEHPGYFDDPDPIHDFRWGPLDHGAAGIGSGLYGGIKTIEITDSNIYAHGLGSGSGIGGGGAGGQSFSVVNPGKWAVGEVGTIRISRSHVEASSGCGEFTDMPPTTIDDGLKVYTINAIDFGTGAGIGSGSASSIGTLEISDCDYIKAWGCGGAGIGGGMETGIFESGKVGTISLKNIGEIEARGGTSCAGIGTGGGQALDSSGGSLKKLSIENCKKVKAKGGRFGAGIGLGEMSRYDNGTGTYVITIKDSEIEARGGHCAAGIGGGSESFSHISTFGGENPPLMIEGACKIFAQGGDTDRSDGGETMYGGGAGIGGGDRGGCSTIKIALTEDEKTPKGSIESRFSSNYYVYAVGGGGAAGIGNGGNDCMEGAYNGNSSDGDSIYIEGGAVFAKGGDSVEWKGVGYTGAGAGIGGSCAGSIIDYLKISGGYICAEAGKNSNENDKADDIGTGGNYADDGDRRKNGTLIISDGTVLADNIGVFEDLARITGGSISGIVPNAVRSGNVPVYRTTLKLADNPQTEVSLSGMTQEYGKNHIYTSPDRKLYLYLDRKGSISDKSQTADVTLGTEAARHYFGYTDQNHTGWLKMRGEKLGTRLESDNHQTIDKVRYLDDFCVALDDDRFTSGDWTFTVSGNASMREEAGKTTSPGARAALNADMVGSYTVRGTSTASDDPEVYWGAYVDFTGQILKPDPKPVIVGVTYKVYDGRVAVGPEVESKSGGEVTYRWFDEYGNTELASAPKNAGKYKVQAFVAETSLFDAGKSEKVSYEIKRKDTQIVLSGSLDGTGATLEVEIEGIISGDELKDAVAILKVKPEGQGSKPEKHADIKNEHGKHVAVFGGEDVPIGYYDVRVWTNFYNTGPNHDSNPNYNEPPEVNQRLYRGKSDRKIIVKKNGQYEIDSNGVTATYGDPYITLTARSNHDVSSDADAYRYEIVSDSINDLNESYNTNAKPTITLNWNSADDENATVSFNHAGTVKIKVTLSDNRAEGDVLYNPAETYITVTVKPKELTAASYACRISDNSINPTPVREISYGQLSLFRYGISYNGLVKGDTPADFTHGYGTLSAIALPAKLNASDTGYQIDIRKNADPVKKIFYSRDYDIKYDVSTNAVRVRKAKLAVKAADTSGEYGPREPDYEWEVASNQSEYGCDGLSRWDSKDSVFITEPAVEYDKTAPSVNGREYGELDAGTYDKALKLDLKGAVSNNYDFVNIPGNLVVKQADISNVMRFGVSTNELKYDGTPKNPDILISDRFYETGDPKYKLSVSSDYVVNCPPEDERINAGTFTAVVKGTGNYTGERKVLCKITSDYYYNCTNGARGSWDIGSKDGFAITYKRNVNDNESRDHFLKLMIDGKEVDKASYDIASDSMTMTLKPDFLTGLGEGYHLFHPVFEDGESQMILFNVKQPGKPDTPVIPVDPVDPPAPPEPPGPDKPDKPVNPDNPVDPKPDDEHNDDSSSSDGGGGSMPAAGSGSVVFPNPIVVMDVTGITQAANKPAVKKPAAENAEPFLEGHGKLKGWDVISKSIEIAIKNKLKDPSVERIIMVNMNGTSVVPANIFKEIKGQDVTLIFEMGDDISWRVNGLDITEDVTEDIDFGVVVGTDEIPVDVVGDVLNDSFGVQLSLAHDGPFGFKATLLMELGEENGGKYANLFYYNEDKGELEFMTSDLIDEGGSISLDFVHASEYVVAVADKAMGDAVVKTVQTPGASDKAKDNTEEAGGQGKAGTAKTEDTQKTGNLLIWWLIAAGLLIISAASGAYYILRKKRN